ncbi:TPA: hypothetical protein MDK20_001021 [Klebsiella aerogenes]|nr:hypothetical protein [Klebsiella aerogenes]
MTEKAEHNNEQEVTGKFAMIPNEILGMLNKNILTPAGTVEKIDGDDLAWWGFFFTFRYQNKPCYQTRNTISARFDCSEKTVTRRTGRLESLGLLTIETRKGTSNIFTASSVEEFLARKTKKKVTPKEESNGEKTKKQSATVSPTAIYSESKSEQRATDDPEPTAPSAGVGKPLPDIHSDQHDDVSASNDSSLSDLPSVNPLTGADAVNERDYADLNTLNHWVEGYDNEGFMAYGATWGIEKPGAITDLIKSHIRKIQSDGYKGSRSAANDTPCGADDYYKQQQAQRIAAAKQGANTPQQQECEPPLDFDETIPF